MSTEQLRNRFLAQVETSIPRERIVELAARCAAAGKKVTAQDRIDLAAALAHAAFLAPDRTAETYDALAEGWRGRAVNATPIDTFDRAPEPSPVGLWKEYWGIVEDGAVGNLDALSVTQRTAALGQHMTDTTLSRIAEMAHLYDGVTEAAARDTPELIKLSTLAACPENSLGREFHDLIVDNMFDLEVLDRDAIKINALPEPLAWLNTRMLQAHDLWHITAGYETTSLHEIAISAFQMAQFGHNYSAQFLSITSVIGALVPERGYPVLMDTITSAWVHGRESPAMILIPWEKVWDQPVDKIRRTYGITAYESPYAPDIIEKSQAFSARIQKVTGFFRGLLRPFTGAPA